MKRKISNTIQKNLYIISFIFKTLKVLEWQTPNMFHKEYEKEEVVKILIFQLKQKLYAFYGDELSSLVFSTPDPNSFQSYKVQTQNSII